jgi:hypothetical protein
VTRRGSSLAFLASPLVLAARVASADPIDEASSADEAQPPESSSAPNAVVVDSPVDVTVTGEKNAPGSASIGKRETRDMPGVLGDPYRGIEIHPSVTPAASGVPYYFIRGAPPGNVGYFFDDIPVPLLFHAGAGPCVIPAGLVQRVELHLGAYPAALGRLAGAVVEADSTPPPNEWRGEAAFRTVDIGGLVQGPAGEKATVLFGGHYSIGTKIVSALVKSIDIDYADYQGRVTAKTSDRGRVTLTTFGSYDYLATVDSPGEKNESRSVLIDSDFHRVDLRYDEELSGGGKAQAAVTFGLDRSRGEGVKSADDFKIDARAKIEKPTGHGALVRFGTDAALDVYHIDVGTEPCQAGGCAGGLLPSEADLANTFRVLFPSRTDLALGGWIDSVIALGDSSTITPGLRVDYYNSLGHAAVGVDPRLVGSFGIGDHLKLIPAIGIASQLPGFAPIPALQIGGIPGGLQRSVQSSFGADVSFPPFEFEATAYRQSTFNLTDAIGANRGAGFGTERFLARSTGDSFGLELSAKSALSEHMFIYAAYTLSRSTREIDGRTVPSAYDRTHVAQLALLFDLGHHWKAGVRNVFYTGFPADEAGPNRQPSTHPDRTRPFYRLDVRLSKRWVWPSGTYVGLVFDMQNATLARETFDVKCTDRQCSPREIGPITIPTLAFEAGF